MNVLDETDFLSQHFLIKEEDGTQRIVEVNYHNNTIEGMVTDKGLTVRAKFDLRKHGHYLNTYSREPRTFAKGEKIIFLKNDHKLKVENGTTGKIVRINPFNNHLTVLTDKKQSVVFNPRNYPYIDYGYATTNYKVQGMTAEQVLYIADTLNGYGYLVLS